MFSRGIYIINLSNNERQPIMMVPREVSITPESEFKAIPSMGRNNPFYHYTGGEDTLEFPISWYVTEETREDVIRACRTLESWTRSDGDDFEPPDIRISFGDLFKSYIWKLTSAPYQVSLFDRPHQMLPTLATQHLTFKKITANNATYNDILGIKGSDRLRNLF